MVQPCGPAHELRNGYSPAYRANPAVAQVVNVIATMVFELIDRSGFTMSIDVLVGQHAASPVGLDAQRLLMHGSTSPRSRNRLSGEEQL
jgi:hypothetical protein